MQILSSCCSIHQLLAVWKKVVNKSKVWFACVCRKVKELTISHLTICAAGSILRAMLFIPLINYIFLEISRNVSGNFWKPFPGISRKKRKDDDVIEKQKHENTFFVKKIMKNMSIFLSAKTSFQFLFNCFSRKYEFFI